MTPEEYLQTLLILKEEGIKFSKWEEDFLDSIEEYLNEKMDLTELQIEKLEEIYNNKV